MSGVWSAQRVMGLAKLEDASEDPRENTLCVYFPVEAVQIVDTWHVSGLRGTGCCDMVAEDVFVPAD